MTTTKLVPKNDYYAGFLYGKCWDPLTSYMRDLIAALVPENTTVLDVGCGTGHQLLRMAPKIKSGVGVDLSDRMIAYASKQQEKKGVEHLLFDLAKADDLSRFDDNEFDLATMTLVMHEMETGDRIPALKEMVRVSKRLIIADYAASPGLLSFALMHFIEMTGGIFHYHLFRSYQGHGGASNLFRKIGLKYIRQDTAMWGMVRIWDCEKNSE